MPLYNVYPSSSTSAQLAGSLSDETGTGAFVLGTSPTITGGTLTALTSLGIRSTGSGAFDLTLANTENLTAGRTLTLALGDAARTLTIGASASVSGTNTGDVAAATDAQARAQTSTTTTLSPSNLQARTAFAAHMNGTDQTGIATGTYTKVTWGTENFDQGSLFDSSTNYRWTPSAGIVRLSAQLYYSAGLTGTVVQCALYKNGSALKIGLGPVIGVTGVVQVAYTDIANGTDYYEIFAYATTATSITVSGDATLTYFCGEQG